MQVFANRETLIGVLDIVLQISEALTNVGEAIGPIGTLFGLGMGAWMTKEGVGKHLFVV